MKMISKETNGARMADKGLMGNKLFSRAVTAVSAAAMAAVMMSGCGGTAPVNSDAGSSDMETKYAQAEKLLNEKQYQEAADLFAELGEYKDSQEYLQNFVFLPTSIKGSYHEYAYAYEVEDGLVKKADVTETTSDRKTETEYVYSYENGYISEISEYEKEGEALSLKTKTDVVYEGGKISKVVSGDSEEVYTYDSNGNLTSAGLYIGEYDANGVKVKDTITDTPLTSEEEVKYESGKIIEESKTALNDFSKRLNDDYRKKYIYENGRPVGCTAEYTEDSISGGEKYTLNSSYEYDENGRISRIDIKADNSRITKERNKKNNRTIYFDESGNAVKCTETDEYGDLTYIYEHDKYGNIVKDEDEDYTIEYQLIGYREKPKNQGRLFDNIENVENTIENIYMPCAGYGIGSIYDEIGIRNAYVIKRKMG